MCSQLWGSSEQNKRLKLLISLGEFHMAADGFSQSKVRLAASVM